jgi:hypothetical protein
VFYNILAQPIKMYKIPHLCFLSGAIVSKKTVDTISNRGSSAYYRFDVHVIEDIEPKSHVYISDGTLTVNGNIGADCIIAITKDPASRGSGMFGGSFSCRSSDTGTKLLVKGNIGANVIIEASTGSLEVRGTIGAGSKLSTGRGDIVLEQPEDPSAELVASKGEIVRIYTDEYQSDFFPF